MWKMKKLRLVADWRLEATSSGWFHQIYSIGHFRFFHSELVQAPANILRNNYHPNPMHCLHGWTPWGTFTPNSSLEWKFLALAEPVQLVMGQEFEETTNRLLICHRGDTEKLTNQNLTCTSLDCWRKPEHSESQGQHANSAEKGPSQWIQTQDLFLCKPLNHIMHRPFNSRAAEGADLKARFAKFKPDMVSGFKGWSNWTFWLHPKLYPGVGLLDWLWEIVMAVFPLFLDIWLTEEFIKTMSFFCKQEHEKAYSPPTKVQPYRDSLLRQVWSSCWKRSFQAASLCCCEQLQLLNDPQPCLSYCFWEARVKRRAWTLSPLTLVLANLPWWWL